MQILSESEYPGVHFNSTCLSLAQNSRGRAHGKGKFLYGN
jgi:hypothetical protein